MKLIAVPLARLTNGAAVRLTGRLVSSPGAGQSHELLVDQSGEVAILGECEPEVSFVLHFARNNGFLTLFYRHIQYKRRTSRRNIYATMFTSGLVLHKLPQ